MAAAHSSVTVTKAELNRIRQMAQRAEANRWREGFEPCAYCGVIAESVDHVPPRSAREGIIATGLAMRYPFVEVPACLECNHVLGARGIWTVKERRDFIKKQLKRRYAKILGIPDWSDSELAQMSKGMQGYISNGLVVRDFVRQRLAFAQVAR